MVNIVASIEPHIEAAAPLPSPGQAPAEAAAASRERLRMGDFLPMAAVCLAIFATMMSAVGLAMTSRTVAEARIAIEALHDAPHEPAPAVPAPLPSAAPTQQQELAAITAALAQLRIDIASERAHGDGAIGPLLRDGQAELANRLSEIAVKVDRIDRTMNARR